MLDADLATLYGVETRELVRAVRRNLNRFPSDFMFRLQRREFENLRSQFGTSSSWGGRRHLPYAFTEHGVAMLSSVLRSTRAVRVNIESCVRSSACDTWRSRTRSSRAASIVSSVNTTDNSRSSSKPSGR